MLFPTIPPPLPIIQGLKITPNDNIAQEVNQGFIMLSYSFSFDVLAHIGLVGAYSQSNHVSFKKTSPVGHVNSKRQYM